MMVVYCRSTFMGSSVRVFVCMHLQEVLVEQRTALGDLLQQLMKQKQLREQELRQVLVRKLKTHMYV